MNEIPACSSQGFAGSVILAVNQTRHRGTGDEALNLFPNPPFVKAFVELKICDYSEK